MKFLQREIGQVTETKPIAISGRVTHVIGLLIESNGPVASVGELCYVYGKPGETAIPCQVVGLKDRKVLLMPLAPITAIGPGAEVYPTGCMHRVAVGPSLCGRVVDGLGRPIDGKGRIEGETLYALSAPAPSPLARKPIREILETKIRAIDALCTLGKGQRIGIFSPPGVGKSTLLGMIARTSQADLNVIALIGERGREVQEFIEHDLGVEGLARSVVVVATSDQPALLRSKGAEVAMAIAEYFRDKGKDVLLLMDSASRYAMALREIGLAIGEPPTTRGYTPSIFAQLPKLFERGGNIQSGSITSLYTVLTEQEEGSDPIPEMVRSLLDGHIYLSRELAAANHFPAIDILHSLSRLMPHLVSSQHMEQARRLRALLHTYTEAADLIHMGAYESGANAEIDAAVEKREPLMRFLQQERENALSFAQTVEALDQAIGRQ